MRNGFRRSHPRRRADPGAGRRAPGPQRRAQPALGLPAAARPGGPGAGARAGPAAAGRVRRRAARAPGIRDLKVEAILDTPVNVVVTCDPTRGGRHVLGRARSWFCPSISGATSPSSFPRSPKAKRRRTSARSSTHPLSLVMIAFVITAGPSYLLTKVIGKNLETST